jgi:hypothetical protein
MKTQRTRPLLAALPLCALLACGGGPTTPSSGDTTNRDGQWSGTTSQGRPISFTVAGDKVTAITIGYNFGGCSGTSTFANLSLDIGTSPFPGAPNIGPGFGFGSGNPELPNYTQVYGNFSTTTAAGGSMVFANFAGCGNAVGIWNAAKR